MFQHYKILSETIKVGQNGTINIVFLDSNSIQKLNNNYRKKDTPTDVLSFHYFDDFSGLHPDDIAGEIVLLEDYIISQWEEYWLWTEKEFYKLVIHSLLHILWYDHENDEEYKEMQSFEDIIWEKVFENS